MSLEPDRARMAAFATFLIVLIVLVVFRPDAIMTLVYGLQYLTKHLSL